MIRGDYSYSQDSQPDICLPSSSVNFCREPNREKKNELNMLGYFGVYNTAFLRGEKLLHLHFCCYKKKHISINLIQVTVFVKSLQCLSKVLTIKSQIFCAEKMYIKLNTFEMKSVSSLLSHFKSVFHFYLVFWYLPGVQK